MIPFHGYLHKIPKGLLTQKEKRYFVIENGSLSYYETETEEGSNEGYISDFFH
jgi:hypothetical protein